jgi:L-rhamnose mutarotase
VKSFGRTLLLQDDPQKIALYKRYHQTVWPEVLESIRRSGVTGMWIFLLERRMFMYVTTTDDYDAARAGARYMERPRVQEWEDFGRT